MTKKTEEIEKLKAENSKLRSENHSHVAFFQAHLGHKDVRSMLGAGERRRADNIRMRDEIAVLQSKLTEARSRNDRDVMMSMLARAGIAFECADFGCNSDGYAYYKVITKDGVGIVFLDSEIDDGNLVSISGDSKS